MCVICYVSYLFIQSFFFFIYISAMSNVVSVTMVLVFHGDDVGNDKPVIFRCLHGPERTKINSRCHHEITILSTPRQLFKIVFFFLMIFILALLSFKVSHSPNVSVQCGFCVLI